MTKQEAFARLEAFVEGIPFEAIRYLYDHEPDPVILEKTRFALEHAYDDDLYYDEGTGQYSHAPLWYSIVAEQHLDLSLLPPVISFYTDYDHDSDFLNEQGLFLLEKLCEKFGEQAVLPVMDAIDRVLETPSDRPYLFLFNCLRYADASQLDRVLSWLDNPNNIWLDALVGQMADCPQFQGSLPKLKALQAHYKAQWNRNKSHSLKDNLLMGEFEYVIKQIKNGEAASPPYSATREHWEEHYKPFAKNFANALPVQPAPKKAAKIGRNEPCPCGSGKKYKKCCLGKGIFGLKE